MFLQDGIGNINYYLLFLVAVAKRTAILGNLTGKVIVPTKMALIETSVNW